MFLTARNTNRFVQSSRVDIEKPLTEFSAGVHAKRAVTTAHGWLPTYAPKHLSSVTTNCT